MTRLWVLRHAPTAWNAARRLQGRHDAGISDAARALWAGRRLPPDLRAATVFCSPLRRCRESVALLGLGACTVVPCLIEADWGAWEGLTAPDIDRKTGGQLSVREKAGLDLQPEGGESPRQVQDRLRPWLATLGRQPGLTALAVTHKGVIRALHAMARAWDMTGPPPDRLLWDRLQGYEIGPDGTPAVFQLNRPLATTRARDRTTSVA